MLRPHIDKIIIEDENVKVRIYHCQVHKRIIEDIKFE